MDTKRQQSLFDDLPDPTSTALSPSRSDELLQDRTVYVVDAMAVIYQVFHALAGAEMTSPRGEPVAAVHGFLRDMLDLLEKRKPDFLFIAFDPPGDSFRQAIYPQYKANRSEMPLDLRDQIGKIRRLLEAFHLPILEVPGFEADDVLATMARIVEARQGQCLLVTPDKDCRQLITPRVSLFNPRRGEIYDAAKLAIDWKVRPDQVVDFQSLVGDSTDNIPGVPGVGPKTAAELLEKFETLESIFEHLDQISGAKRKENLVNGRDSAFMSRQLVRLDPQVPIEIDWDRGRADRFDFHAAASICREYGFRSLTDRLERLQRDGRMQNISSHLDALAAPQPANSSATFAAEPSAETSADDWQANYRAVLSREELSAFLAEATQAGRITIDTETTSTRPRFASLVGISLCYRSGDAIYLPVRAPQGTPTWDWKELQSLLAPVFANPKLEKIGQNLKYDLIVLHHHGLEIIPPWFDTLVADYLIDAGQRNHGIDDLAHRHLGHRTIRIVDLIGKGQQQKSMDQVPLEAITDYAAEDADVPTRLRELLGSRLQSAGLQKLFDDVEMPLISVLATMESNGIAVDRSVLERLGQELEQRIQEHEQAIYAMAGREFNIDSRPQLSAILFDELKLPVQRRTKTGASTDAEVLTELAHLHPLPARLLEYRQDSKLKNTYVDTLPELIHPDTGRIHTSFMQDVAATGRLSSKDPNLQNIPVRTETGRAIRTAFVPGEPGWSLLAADYSQIELRVLAHFTQDEALQAAFLADADIHAIVAAEVSGIPLEQVTSDLRRQAKAVNFGVLYGQSPFGLAKSLGIPQDEAAAFINAYFERYPSIDRFMDQVLEEAETTGQVQTILGRRRLVDGVRSKTKRGDSRQRNLAERIAINTVVQGSAADIIKLAMLRVHVWLGSSHLRARLLLQIHDELLLEVHDDDLDQAEQGLVQSMSSAITLSVPLKVDAKSGRNWAECT